MAEKRLFKELNQLAKNPPHTSNPQILSLGPADPDDIFYWHAEIAKPSKADSPYYYSGRWRLNIKPGHTYPSTPPAVSFDRSTPINHPNVNIETGEICLDILKSEHWSPAWNLNYLVVAVLLLIDDPEPDSPLNIDSANLFRHDKVAFESVVQYHLWKHGSMEPRPDNGVKQSLSCETQPEPKQRSVSDKTPVSTSSMAAPLPSISAALSSERPISPTETFSQGNVKIIQDVGEEVTKQFIAKVNEIGHSHHWLSPRSSNTSSVDYSTDDDLDSVRKQVTKNVTMQVERLCLKSTSPELEERRLFSNVVDSTNNIITTHQPMTDYVTKAQSKNNYSLLHPDDVEKIKQQFLKLVDDKVSEVTRKQEEYRRNHPV